MDRNLVFLLKTDSLAVEWMEVSAFSWCEYMDIHNNVDTSYMGKCFILDESILRYIIIRYTIVFMSACGDICITVSMVLLLSRVQRSNILLKSVKSFAMMMLNFCAPSLGSNDRRHTVLCLCITPSVNFYLALQSTVFAHVQSISFLD